MLRQELGCCGGGKARGAGAAPKAWLVAWQADAAD